MVQLYALMQARGKPWRQAHLLGQLRPRKPGTGRATRLNARHGGPVSRDRSGRLAAGCDLEKGVVRLGCFVELGESLAQLSG